jgi:4'-phosphopantetheinyl transferase
MGSPTLVPSIRPRQAADAIRPGEVHAWVVDLDELALPSGPLLDDAERSRAQSYLRRQDGARFAASRAGLRLILAGYLGAEPASLRFQTGPGGRPRLAGIAPAGAEASQATLQFSLTRSADLALIAVSAGRVGADVERIVPRPGLTDLAAAGFAGREAAGIATGCCGSPLRGFYRHWTAREAYLKAIGCGLAGLRHVEFCCCPIPAIRFGGTQTAGRTLTMVDISPSYTAAVVASQPVSGCWRLVL